MIKYKNIITMFFVFYFLCELCYSKIAFKLMLSVGQIFHYFQIAKRQVYNIFDDLFFFFFFKIYLGIFLFLNLALWIFVFYIKKIIDEPRIALHYNVDFGIDYYGSINNLFIFPVLGLLIFVANTLLFAIVRNQQDRKFIGQILCIVGVLANLILLVGLASIYLINFK